MVDKNREIVFVSVTNLLQSAMERFSLEELLSLGYHFTTVDLTPMIDPEIAAKISAQPLQDERFESFVFHNAKEFETFLKIHQGAYYFLMFDYYYEVRKVYQLLTKYNVDYGNVTTALTDSGFMPSNYGHGVKDFDFGRLSPEKWGRIFFNRIVRPHSPHKPSNFQIIGGWNNEEQIWHNCCCKEGVTKKIYIRSFDYERFLHAEPYDNGGKPYAVFLDQYMPYHPDFKDYNIWKIRIPEKEYFEQTHEILDVIQERYGMDVIIAAHPRGNYDDHPGVWKNCPLIYGKSAELAKNASLVLTHFSNSITFAAMAHKPAMLLNIPLWDQSNHFTSSCKMWADMLGAPVVRHGSDLHDTFDYTIDEEKYRAFNHLFTQSRENDDRPFWEIAMEEIDE